MSAEHNDLILATCLEHGYLTQELHQSACDHLAANPDAPVLDWLWEQQLVTEEVYHWLASLGQEGEPQPTHAEPIAIEATQILEVVRGPSVIEPPAEMPTRVQEFLRLAAQADASDVHLGVNAAPLMRRFGELVPMWPGAPLLTAEQTDALANAFLDQEQLHNLKDHGDCDFCYATPEGRYRTSVIRQRLGTDMVFRLISSTIRTMADLGLPDMLKRLTQFHNGLVLVTGPVGCGKSTTLASLIDEVNHTRHDHIITLEDPIEYKFDSSTCHVTQREVVHHTRSFASALRAALREDPDIIMVGEMRDLETISLAITAAETGHLVLSTLHTANAARTLDRVLDVFPVDQQAQIRVMVSESLRGIISQQLIPRADGTGRVLALEILINTPAVASLIRDGKTFMLPGVMQTGKKQGMRLMDDSILELLNAGIITPMEAWERAENKKNFEQYLRK